MLRLTLLLCLGMLAALFTLGEDRGQLRPGLAKADAEGRLDAVWAEARAKSAPVAQPGVTPVAVVAEVASPLKPVPEPVLEPVPEPTPVAPAPVTLASNGPVIEVDAGREVVRAVEEPVFSLSTLGNALVPGEDGTPVTVAESALDAPIAEGTIWYVTANSVNVRAAPSTDAEVVDRLGNGEAALLVSAVDSEWARIVIQGDGVEGYVALRYLSQTAP
jgi:uncharacterized protein YgiM (DUF1202 family)